MFLRLYIIIDTRKFETYPDKAYKDIYFYIFIMVYPDELADELYETVDLDRNQERDRTLEDSQSFLKSIRLLTYSLRCLEWLPDAVNALATAPIPHGQALLRAIRGSRTSIVIQNWLEKMREVFDEILLPSNTNNLKIGRFRNRLWAIKPPKCLLV